MYGDEVVDNLVDVGPRVAHARDGGGAVPAQEHAGLHGAHHRVALVLQVRLGDARFNASQRVLRRLNGNRRARQAVTT